MRISDWSSDVCSSDLLLGQPRRGSRRAGRRAPGGRTMKLLAAMVYVFAAAALFLGDANWRDRRGCPEPWYVQVPRAALWPVYVALYATDPETRERLCREGGGG